MGVEWKSAEAEERFSEKEFEGVKVCQLASGGGAAGGVGALGGNCSLKNWPRRSSKVGWGMVSAG